jgi:hypothetical protein
MSTVLVHSEVTPLCGEERNIESLAELGARHAVKKWPPVSNQRQGGGAGVMVVWVSEWW